MPVTSNLGLAVSSDQRDYVLEYWMKMLNESNGNFVLLDNEFGVLASKLSFNIYPETWVAEDHAPFYFKSTVTLNAVMQDNSIVEAYFENILVSTGVILHSVTQNGTTLELVFYADSAKQSIVSGFIKYVYSVPGADPLPTPSANVMSKTFTANGVYDAHAENKDGYNPITIDVTANIVPLSVSANGTYSAPEGADGYAPVAVNVPDTGTAILNRTLEILENDQVFDPIANFLENRALSKASFENCYTLPSSAFAYDSILREVDCPKTTYLSGQSNFIYCVCLKKVNLPLVSIITQSAFAGCSMLQEINVSNAGIVNTSAFYSCYDLKSISLPNCNAIAPNTFNNCSNLSKIILCNCSLTNLQNVNAFSNTPFSLSSMIGVFGSIYVPSVAVSSFKAATNWITYSDRITALPSEYDSMYVYMWEFYQSTLSEVPSAKRNAKQICCSAFQNCSALTEANFPECEKIHNLAFTNCYSLSSISFPKCEFVANAFQNCSVLTEVSFPVCKVVWNNAFYSCNYLKTADFPECEQIGSSAFAYCSRLSSINAPKCKIICSSAFYYCSSLTTANFPECEVLCGNAFQYCYSLSSINFPKCKKFSDNFHFSNCSQLREASFPELLNITYGAFNSCYSLSSINFPKCRFISNMAFTYCSALTEASFPACRLIGPNAFSSCSSLTIANFPECIKIDGYAFQDCKSLVSISFLKCEEILGYAFSGCSRLTIANFPECIAIGAGAFQYCSSLSSISFPKCKDLQSYAFQNCSALTEVIFPECEIVRYGALQYCSSLAQASFSKCNVLFNRVFYSCINLSKLYLLNPSMVSLFNGTENFLNTPITNSAYLGYYGSIYVRASLLSEYQNDSMWSVYSERLVGLTDEQIAQLDNQ